MKKLIYLILILVGVFIVSCGTENPLDALAETDSTEETTSSDSSTSVVYVTNVVVTNTTIYTTNVQIVSNYSYLSVTNYNSTSITNYIYTSNFVYINTTNSYYITNYVFVTNSIYFSNSYNSSFKAVQATNYTIYNGWNKILFTQEEWDLNDEFIGGTFTVSEDGLYLFTGMLRTGKFTWDLEIRKNGTAIYTSRMDVSTTSVVPIEFTIFDYGTAGDYYEVWATDSLNMLIREDSFFSGIRLQ